MTTSDIWMTLEALAHLRGLPEYANLRRKLESNLADANNALNAPAPAPAPKKLEVDDSAKASAKIERKI